MKIEVYEAQNGNYNLNNYEETYENFNWDDVKKAFSWYETGKMNMAYECIDRHVDEGKGDKIALNYRDERRKEQYTFKQLKTLSNQAANVLVEKQMYKKVIEYLSSCLVHLNFILHS